MPFRQDGFTGGTSLAQTGHPVSTHQWAFGCHASRTGRPRLVLANLNGCRAPVPILPPTELTAAIGNSILRLRQSDRTRADGASTMTISFAGFKSVSVAVLAVLWLAAPPPATAYGEIRIVPNVNPDPVKPGTLAQEAQVTDEAAVDAEEGDSAAEESAAEESPAEEPAAEESSDTEAPSDGGESDAAEESEEASGEEE